MEWYYEHGGAQNGPVSENELASLVQSGAINGSTRVWNANLTDWSPLSVAAPQFVPAQVHAAPVQNPYQTPQNFGAGVGGGGVRQGVPGFVKGWMITDIVLCSFHLIAVLGFAVQLAEGFSTGITLLNLLCSLVIGGLGLPAAIMILNGKSGGVPLAWVVLVATIVQIAVGIFATSAIGGVPRGIAGPFMIGVLLQVVARGTLLIFYGMAVSRANAYFQSTRSTRQF
ncbi:MAG: hypothetical protein ACI8UO_005725 [Verrucomicrobiales bacterium]|jgi:hypothetical protein